MDPDKFGPGTWLMLHHATFAYPDQPFSTDKRNYHALITLLGKLLPCSICATHFQRLLQKHPLKHALRSRGVLVRWLCMMHTRVNKGIEGKRTRPKPPSLASLLSISAKAWQKGLRDLIYCMAIVTPKKYFPLLKRWIAAAAAVYGPKYLPKRLSYATRGALLNGINAHYRKPKTKVLAHYKPWMGSKPSNRSWSQKLLASAFGSRADTY